MPGVGSGNLAPLIDRPVAIIPDARLRKDHDVVTERLLSISGEDALTVDRKYKDPWIGRLPSRIVILTNELPRLGDASGARASRFVILQFTRSFLGKEDPTLTETLLTELPGILNWALDGLERLTRRGHFVQPESSVETMRDLEDLGSPVRAFTRDRCELDPNAEVEVDQLFRAWQRWCETTGHHATSKQAFARDLHGALGRLDIRQQKEWPHRYYQGIRLIPERTDPWAR